MKTEIVKNYLNIDRLAEELYDIFKECRDSYITNENMDLLLDMYSENNLHNRAFETAIEFNDDMKRYLNSDDHKIYGNFNNVDYDYPRHIKGEYVYDNELVKAMIDRLNKGEESKQTEADRDWLTSWFWDTFGTGGISYNFNEEIADTLYEYDYKN